MSGVVVPTLVLLRILGLGTVQPVYIVHVQREPGLVSPAQLSSGGEFSFVGDGGRVMAYSKVTLWAWHWVHRPHVSTLVRGVLCHMSAWMPTLVNIDPYISRSHCWPAT